MLFLLSHTQESGMNKYKPVDVSIRWPDLFQKEMSPEIRRERWEKWKEVAGNHDEQGREMVAYWSNSDETCTGCVHRDGDWCKHSDLPCNVNPILTIRHGQIGMACMGLGYVADSAQPELFYK